MKPKGLFTVVGSLDISQFWSVAKGTNSSDGDIVHLKVDHHRRARFRAADEIGKRLKV